MVGGGNCKKVEGFKTAAANGSMSHWFTQSSVSKLGYLWDCSFSKRKETKSHLLLNSFVG